MNYATHFLLALYEEHGDDIEFYKKLQSSFEKVESSIYRIREAETPTQKDIDFQIYEIGKETFGKENLRLYFKCLYTVLFGTVDGPRMGMFIEIMGIDEFLYLFESKVSEIMNR